MIFITKWVERRIQKKIEKKREETKLKNWFKLYTTLHCGKEPVCLECANHVDCYNKYGKKKENWPTIEGKGSCQSFHEIAYPQVTINRGARGYQGGFGASGISGISGLTGVAGNYNIGGYSGYVKYKGTYPPWNRGANSCNHLCNVCPYLKNNVCTKP